MSFHVHEIFFVHIIFFSNFRIPNLDITSLFNLKLDSPSTPSFSRVRFGLIISWEYVRQVAPVRRLKSGSNLSVKVKALIDWDEISCTILLCNTVVVCTVFTTVAPSHIANDANRIRTRGGFTVKIFFLCMVPQYEL